MSRLSLAPNYCSCTVNRARNLPNKGKNGGVDPFCTISMGKDKFVTAVCQNTSSPDWHEQCEMQIVDDAKIKLTVYHNTKSSLSKGDFIGRVYVSLRDLQDYDQIHTNWYKLSNKDGKFDKERGEIEVSLQFYSKNNTTGSVLDLATKRKHLSLKDIRHSLSDKFKTATRQRKQDKNSGDNQLHDQSHRLSIDGGSMYNVRDFLDDSTSETTSFTGSHMSLNSMSYNTNVEQQRKNDNRFSNLNHQTPINRNRNATLPDIVGEPTTKNSSSSGTKKPVNSGLCVLGYENIKSVPVNPQIRHELDYLDREELLHVIAYQTDLLKKRDTRVKDLENYTDGLLVKIVEQCPSILQVGSSSKR